jgi:hypothetical protein
LNQEIAITHLYVLLTLIEAQEAAVDLLETVLTDLSILELSSLQSVHDQFFSSLPTGSPHKPQSWIWKS